MERVYLAVLGVASLGMLAFSLGEAGSMHYPLAYPQVLLVVIGLVFFGLLAVALRRGQAEPANGAGRPATVPARAGWVARAR